MFANGLEDLGSIPGRVIPKIQKMVFDASLLNTQHYKVGIKGKVGQSWERSRTPLHLEKNHHGHLLIYRDIGYGRHFLYIIKRQKSEGVHGTKENNSIRCC